MFPLTWDVSLFNITSVKLMVLQLGGKQDLTILTSLDSKALLQSILSKVIHPRQYFNLITGAWCLRKVDEACKLMVGYLQSGLMCGKVACVSFPLVAQFYYKGVFLVALMTVGLLYHPCFNLHFHQVLLLFIFLYLLFYQVTNFGKKKLISAHGQEVRRTSGISQR